jgi:hypothetical protein
MIQAHPIARYRVADLEHFAIAPENAAPQAVEPEQFVARLRVCSWITVGWKRSGGLHAWKGIVTDQPEGFLRDGPNWSSETRRLRVYTLTRSSQITNSTEIQRSTFGPIH